MGIFQDLLDNAKTFKSRSQLASYIQNLINRKLDPANPTVAAATDAVHSIATSTQTSGNMTLTVTLRNGETFTTGNIAYNANAATVEGALDTAATSASITGWTNGDISVSGTAVNDGPIVLTFDGDSVSGTNHPVTVLTDVSGAGGAWGAVSITTDGQSVRRALGVLVAEGVVDDGTIPAQALSQASNTAFVAGGNADKVPQWVIRALGRELAAEDGNNDIYHSLVASLDIDDKARLSQYLGNSSVV